MVDLQLWLNLSSRMRQGTAGSQLLSSTELDRYFPNRKVGLWVGSWNMAEIKVGQVHLLWWVLVSLLPKNNNQTGHNLEHLGRIPFTCSRTVYCVLEHSSGMLERNILAQFYWSVLNGVFSEHCSFTLKYNASFRHLESHGNSVSRCATPRFI